MRLMATGLVTLLACAACSRQTVNDEVPALLVEPTPAQHTALLSAIATLMGETPLTIADDALTESSAFTLERPRPAGPVNSTATGRVLGVPERIRLVKIRDACVIIHEPSGARVLIARIQCTAE
jgi:hypothetical protein